MKRFRLKTGELEWREVDGEIVALHGPSSNYLSANSSAALLWRALDGEATRDELASKLVDAYGIDAEVAGADVDRFLAELEANDLLEVVTE